jgi:hypothetical protein
MREQVAASAPSPSPPDRRPQTFPYGAAVLPFGLPQQHIPDGREA